MNKVNLEILLKGLDNVVPDTFTMAVYSDEDIRDEGIGNMCGTSACVVGHGTTMKGIKAIREDADGDGWLDFDAYCKRVFDIHKDGPMWEFLFSDNWKELDNSIEGAQDRLAYILLGGFVGCHFDAEDLVYEDSDEYDCYLESRGSYAKWKEEK